jgi:hypothetical protein
VIRRRANAIALRRKFPAVEKYAGQVETKRFLRCLTPVTAANRDLAGREPNSSAYGIYLRCTACSFLHAVPKV